MIRRTYDAGTAIPSGFQAGTVAASGTATFGPVDAWYEVQIHGDSATLSYVIVPAPGLAPATAPAFQPLPDQRTALRLMPGAQLLIRNGHNAAAQGYTLVCWPVVVFENPEIEYLPKSTPLRYGG